MKKFVKFLSNNIKGVEDNEYHKQVWLHFATGCVAKAYGEITQDRMPVFMGASGIGKTSAFELLCPHPSTFVLLNNDQWSGDQKSRVELCAGRLIVCLDELNVRSRKHNDKLKTLLTTNNETVRMAYRRDPVVIPRCWSYYATAERSMLNSDMGERRFAPVVSSATSGYTQKEAQKRAEKIIADRDMYWRFAKLTYEHYGHIQITENVSKEIEKITTDDRYSEIYATVYNFLKKENKPRVCMAYLIAKNFPLQQRERIDHSIVEKALKDCKYIRKGTITTRELDFIDEDERKLEFSNRVAYELEKMDHR